MTGRGRSILIRLSGEIAMKSRRVRSRFQRRLARNLRDALESEGLGGQVGEEWSRLYVRGADPGVAAVAARVFGVTSLSVIEDECPAELGAIVSRGAELYGERVAGRRYAVKARRSGEHPFRSRDVQVKLGAALNPGATVDLDDPEVTVRVEVRGERAYFYGEPVPGPGGLPLGVQDRALALVSGGFDSAVAAWMTMRRGVSVDFLHCDLAGGVQLRQTLRVLKLLADRWAYGSRPVLHVVDFEPVVRELRERSDPGYWQLVLKRAMYRGASELAGREGYPAIVTGESIGQVSSQTLRNLCAIDSAADVPVLRPLLGFDKEEIIARARTIGSYELSAAVRELCSLGGGHPVTAAREPAARAEEEKMRPRVLRDALEAPDRYDLRSTGVGELAALGLFVERIREGDVVIDARPRAAYERWHWPGARRLEPGDLPEDASSLELDPGARYVLYCATGLETARMAERLQESGLEAYSLRGGARAARRMADAGELAGAGPAEGRP